MKKRIIQISAGIFCTIFISSCGTPEVTETVEELTPPSAEENTIDYNSATQESIEDLKNEIDEGKNTVSTTPLEVPEVTKDTKTTESTAVTNALDKTTQEIDSIIKDIMSDDTL